MLGGIIGQGERPTVAIWAQPHVDPEHEAISGDLVERLDHLPTELGEELVITDGARGVGLPVLGVGKDEIDVG